MAVRPVAIRPQHVTGDGESRGITDDNGQNSLTAHERPSLLTVRYIPDLCKAEPGAVRRASRGPQKGGQQRSS
jgi:hypothetical protein